VKRLALNVSRFVGRSSAIKGKIRFLGLDGRVWIGGNNTTETLPGNRAASDIRAREAAGVPALVERNEL
jgi:hypothetical protein